MSPFPTPIRSIAPIQKKLFSWYDQYQRDLPWRGIHDPYATFVSEMMLQQTQVKTVIPYYERFLSTLPNWKSLANAPEEKILKLWEGLGYYRRARNLQAAARKVLHAFGGQLPQTREEILQLPGVGPYSAGAILSIAFQKPEPVVDGNVMRVFSRLFVLRGDLKTGKNHQKVWEIAHHLLSRERPGDFNQALMELGATVCLSENPLCLLCPLFEFCEAAQRGIQADLPDTGKKTGTIEISVAAALLRNKNTLLVKKRGPQEKWLKGLWEFPSAEGKTLKEARQKLEIEWGIQMEEKIHKQIRHQITNHKIRLTLFPAKGKIKNKSTFRWVTPAALEKLPFSSAQGKLRQWVLHEFLPKNNFLYIPPRK